MNKKLSIALAFGGMVFAAQAAAQVTFYEKESFQGRSFSTQQGVRDFGQFGFNDRASSAMVTGTRWEVCDDVRFRGNCMVLRPGRYPSLAALGLNDRISSARAVDSNARVNDNRYAPQPAVAHVVFFENEGFSGRSFISEGQVDNFRSVGFNDRASSVEVVGDRWEACDDAGFRGRCIVLRPGRYPSLASMGMNDRISSVRALSANTRIDENRYAPAPGYAQDGERRDYRRRNQERVYEANVTSVRAVVGQAEQRCWIEKEQVQGSSSNISVPGAIGGAVIGGIIGHQLGGHNSDVATVGGAAIGGLAGANINRITGQPQTQDVQKCASAPSRTPTYWDVSYNFRGQDHRVQMTSQPGPTVTVNEQGEPRT